MSLPASPSLPSVAATPASPDLLRAAAHLLQQDPPEKIRPADLAAALGCDEMDARIALDALYRRGCLSRAPGAAWYNRPALAKLRSAFGAPAPGTATSWPPPAAPEPGAEPWAAQAPEELELPIADVVVDPDLQPRAETDRSANARYADFIQEGVTMPPLVVFDIGGKDYLVDGFHRFAAHRMAGTRCVRVKRYVGTRRDALLYALQVNRANALHLRDAHRRRIVRLALTEGGLAKLSDRLIARRLGVSHPLVADVRKEVGFNPGPRQGTDGRLRMPPVSPKEVFAATASTLLKADYGPDGGSGGGRAGHRRVDPVVRLRSVVLQASDGIGTILHDEGFPAVCRTLAPDSRRLLESRLEELLRHVRLAGPHESAEGASAA